MRLEEYARRAPPSRQPCRRSRRGRRAAIRGTNLRPWLAAAAAVILMCRRMVRRRARAHELGRQRRDRRAGGRRPGDERHGAARPRRVAGDRRRVAGAGRGRPDRQRRRRAEYAGSARGRAGAASIAWRSSRARSTRASGRRRSSSTSIPRRRSPSISAAPTRCTWTRGGQGLLRVTHGWVGFERDGRETYVPEGAVCATRADRGPGTPRYEDAPSATARR